MKYNMELNGKKITDWETDAFMVKAEDIDIDHWLFTFGEFENGRELTENQLDKLSKKYRNVLYDIFKYDIPKDSHYHEKYGNNLEGIVERNSG